MIIERLGIAKSTLLTAITCAKAISFRAASVALTCCHKVREILTEICDVSVGLVANVRVCLSRWSIVDVTSIRQYGRVDGGDDLVSVLNDLLFDNVKGVSG